MGSAGEGGNELNAHHRAPPGDVAGSEPRAKGHRDASNGIAASIPIVVMPRYNAQTGSLPALAQAFGNEIVVGLSDVVRSTHPNIHNVIAHELGHALGGQVLFADQYVDPMDHPMDNLMNNWANRLTRAQCAEAYQNAEGVLAQ